MDETTRQLPINSTLHIPVLKIHLLHILDTTQLLLNLESCTLSLTTGDGNDALNVSSSVRPTPVTLESNAPTHPPPFDTDETFQFRQCLELRIDKITEAASAHHTPIPLSDSMDTHRTYTVESDRPGNSTPFIELQLTRKARYGGLTRAEISSTQRVLQSINRAIVTCLDDRTHDYYASTLERLLAHLCIGFIKLDRNLDIVDKSDRVDDLLASTASYRCESNRLVKISSRAVDIVKRTIDVLRDKHLPYNIVDVVSTRHDGQCAIVVTQLASNKGTSGDEYLVYILCSVADRFEASDLLNFWHITPAEKRVLAGLTRFGNIKKVALELGISPNTVKSQLKSAYKKLGVDNKISLLRRFSLLRLIDALTHQR
jgi:DNA-binding CsgD family transcriptional regulator